MDEYGWGLTSAGFRRPTYNELLDALEHKARELFGATANLTVRSPLGLFLRIFASSTLTSSITSEDLRCIREPAPSQTGV